MKNNILNLFFLFFCLFAFAKKANASLAATPQLSFQNNIRDTIYVASEAEILAKKELLSELKQLRIISNLAFLAIPLLVVTFGLTFIAGIILTIIAIAKLIKIQNKIKHYPWFRDDPDLAQKIESAFLRTGIHLVIYFLGILFFLFLLIDSFFFIDSILSLSLAIGITSLATFFTLDKFSFITKRFFK